MSAHPTDASPQRILRSGQGGPLISANETAGVIVGVDTHADTHHVAVISEHGQHLRDQKFPTTSNGYLDIIAFIAADRVIAVGVEGTGTYGAELTRVLQTHGLAVVEVNRPNRQHRRLRGKSDPIDAYEAAHSALAGRRTSTPKRRDGYVEALRAIQAARTSAIKARTMVQIQLKSLLITAPEEIRAKYRNGSDAARLKAITASRPGGDLANPDVATMIALRRLARRYWFLTEEIEAADTELAQIIAENLPAITQIRGVGTAVASQLLITIGDNPERIGTEAQFAALTGVAPIPASSGKTSKHRLSRAGDRAANAALHHIALARMANDPRTRSYVAKRVSEGKTKKETIRCLKRYIARELFRTLSHPEGAVATSPDLRQQRLGAGQTLVAAAQHLGVWPVTIRRIEAGTSRDSDLRDRYLEWLETQDITKV